MPTDGMRNQSRLLRMQVSGPRGGERSRPHRRAVRRVLTWLFATELGARAVRVALADDVVLTRALNELSDRVADGSDLDRSAPDELVRPTDFSDCHWLLSPSVIDHGSARLMLDEAAHLWNVVRSLEEPRVAEIGRFHGGTCFLLVAAGGFVLSVDIDPGVEPYDRKLLDVLSRCGLSERVDLRVADSRALEIEPESLDVVFVDGDHSYEGASADVEHWWPALRVGGHLVMHDGKHPVPARPWANPWKIDGSCRVADEVRTRDDVVDVPAPGTLVHVVKRL